MIRIDTPAHSVPPADDFLTLVYVSTLAPGDVVATLAEIAAESEPRNFRDNITGVLLFDGADVLQLVEGPGPAVSALRLRLLADPRHHDMEILALAPTPGPRLFPRWDLACLPMDDPASAIATLRGKDESGALAGLENLLSLLVEHRPRTAPGLLRARRLSDEVRRLVEQSRLACEASTALLQDLARKRETSSNHSPAEVRPGPSDATATLSKPSIARQG
jgi:hypothetical protein